MTPSTPPRPSDAARGGAPLPVALEQERERVVQALSTHYAYDRLSLEAVEDRLERAYRATTPEALRALLADLPATTAEELAAASRVSAAARADEVPARGFAFALMGGVERKGAWVVPRHFKVTAVAGGAVIDLREARFAPGVTEIDVFVFMGGVEVFVRPGVRVECSGGAVMGGFDADTDDPATASPLQPVVRLNGMAIWGAVEAQSRYPGESAGAYKKRRREERRRQGGR